MTTGIKTDITTITPDLAEVMLSRNTHNRKIGQAVLKQIKASLVRGEWKLNGEAVKIARDGTILDGQHRLRACVETGIPFQTLVIEGLEHDTQDTMDTGKTRTPADVLALHGYQNTTTLAATLTSIIRTEEYSLRAAVRAGGGTSTNPITRKQMLDRLEAEPDLVAVSNFGKKYGRIGISGRVASTLYYVFSKIDKEDAEHFFDKLWTGEGLGRGNPILVLRNQLISLKEGSKATVNMTFVTALTIKAWNKFRDGDDCSLLRFRTGGAHPEAFPEPH